MITVVNLTAEQGAAIGAAIIHVWAVGLAFRLVIKTLKSRSDDDE